MGKVFQESSHSSGLQVSYEHINEQWIGEVPPDSGTLMILFNSPLGIYPMSSGVA